MKKKKYLPLYYKWGRKGFIPNVKGKLTDGGLCSIFDNDPLLKLLTPKGIFYLSYWGFIHDKSLFYPGSSFRYIATKFGPLRQNVVLLLAAMNDDL